MRGLYNKVLSPPRQVEEFAKLLLREVAAVMRPPRRPVTVDLCPGPKHPDRAFWMSK